MSYPWLHDSEMAAARAEHDAGTADRAGGQAPVIPSVLDETAVAAMRADAAANVSPFTDPSVLRKAEGVLAGIDAGWLERVIGHRVASWRHLNNAELLLAIRAAEADAEHLGALADSQRAALTRERQAAVAAARAKAQAAADRWQRLREQLPVAVTVQHNWTARHLDGYEQGANHIVILADLEAGRFRRAAGMSLCQTPSRARQLRHVSGGFGDERRLPDCKACLRYAEKLVAAAPGSGDAEPGTDHERVITPGAPVSPLAADDDDENPAAAPTPGKELREAAHEYLENGLLPVPAWAARQNGECCCPRGAGCDRPGKHPRSVRSGPGSRDYSWKPLACRTHSEIDQRFGPGGEYADGNLMVAIPGQMMAIDRDDDDGGRAAFAELAGELGELPPTLAHRTPHGEHLIYRTPPGWAGRAWVGKDPANPVPPGVDLRMPGQILMAAPSVVPGPDGPARYGPITGDHVAALPALYVTAWTPPQPQPRPTGFRVPVPPEGADRAARYVHNAMTRIAADLASRQPGGRNAAAYAAGLKAGSLLGAARATPGAGQAAAAWTDEAAEEALMDAAERNGYTGKDGQAEALRAIRSGLRNGLRNPRALPDFTADTRPGADRRQPPHRPASSSPAHPQRSQAAVTLARWAGRWQDMVPEDIRRQIEAADQAAGNRRRAAVAAHKQALQRHQQSPTAGTNAELERTRAASDAAHRAYTHDGRHVTGRHHAAMLRWAAAITAQRAQNAERPAPDPADSARMQANRAAVAANEAYKAGDLDRARELTEQAAALDPSRSGLWQQHRNDIAARQLSLSARAAHTEGDHERAGKLLLDARQLDPRLRTLWDGSLSVQPAARITRQASRQDAAPRGPGGTARANRSAASPARGQQRQPASTAQPGQRTLPSAWASAPPRREPGHHAPTAPQPAAVPSSSQPAAAKAAPREPRAPASADAQDPDPVASEDPARWPSPNPRGHAQAARQATGTNQHAAAERGGRNPAAPDPALTADWRDQILRDARQPWQPGPSWPHHPALSRAPQTETPDAGIEPGR